MYKENYFCEPLQFGAKTKVSKKECDKKSQTYFYRLSDLKKARLQIEEKYYRVTVNGKSLVGCS